MWYVRSNPKVIAAFADVWDVDKEDLIVSCSACCCCCCCRSHGFCSRLLQLLPLHYDVRDPKFPCSHLLPVVGLKNLNSKSQAVIILPLICGS